MRTKKNRGIALVEVLIGSAIISVGILALSTSYATYVNYALSNQKNVQASYLLEEGLEAITFLRDKGWSANITPLSTSTTYYISWNGTYWATTTTAQYVDGQFLRSISMGDVRRGSNDRISTTTGTVDPNSKQITVTIDYFQGHATSTQVMSTYISNIYSN